jgi:transposase
MLSEADEVDIHVLKRQGMTISEIARRTDHDRKTIRSYLAGDRAPGCVNAPSRTCLASSA